MPVGVSCPGNPPPYDPQTEYPYCDQVTGRWSIRIKPKGPDNAGPPPNLNCPSETHQEWDPIALRWVCVQNQTTPPPPPPAAEPGGIQCPPGERPNPGGTRCVPIAAPPSTPGGTQTITDLLARFYTPNWDDYLLSGQLGTGVAQPTGDLLDLLRNSLFQQSVGRYGISPMQQWQLADQFRPHHTPPDRGGGGARDTRGGRFPVDPGERPEGILGLAGGAAALGYIDPSWLHDWTTRTVSTPGSTPGTTPGVPPGVPTTSPGPAPGNPCGGLQGCPPGQHRGGCHMGNPCKPDSVMTAQVLGSRPQVSTMNNPAALLNPGGLTTSQVLGR